MSSYHFDHLHQVTPDPEKAAQFYVNMFGAKVLNTRNIPGGRVLISMELGGAPVSLISPPHRTRKLQFHQNTTACTTLVLKQMISIPRSPS